MYRLPRMICGALVFACCALGSGIASAQTCLAGAAVAQGLAAGTAASMAQNLP